MLFGGKKERQTEEYIRRHIDVVGEVISALHRTMQEYCEECTDFEVHGAQVLDKESEADGIRREIEQELYDGAFMPIQRGDYAALVESVDKVANQAEAAAQFMMLTCPELTPEVRDGLIDIMEATVRCYSHVSKMFENFEDGLTVMKAAHAVEEEEKNVDTIFAKRVSELFKSDIDLARKIHIKMALDRTAAISNRIEDASDRFCTVVSKRP